MGWGQSVLNWIIGKNPAALLVMFLFVCMFLITLDTPEINWNLQYGPGYYLSNCGSGGKMTHPLIRPLRWGWTEQFQLLARSVEIHQSSYPSVCLHRHFNSNLCPLKAAQYSQYHMSNHSFNGISMFGMFGFDFFFFFDTTLVIWHQHNDVVTFLIKQSGSASAHLSELFAPKNSSFIEVLTIWILQHGRKKYISHFLLKRPLDQEVARLNIQNLKKSTGPS